MMKTPRTPRREKVRTATVTSITATEDGRYRVQVDTDTRSASHTVRAVSADVAARFAGVVGKGPEPRDVDLGRVDEAGDDQHGGGGEDDPARNVGQERRGLDADVVEHGLRRGDDRDEDHDLDVR